MIEGFNQNQRNLSPDTQSSGGVEHQESGLSVNEILELLRSRQEGLFLSSNDALKLIEAGKGASVAEYLHKFEDLSNDIALKLIKVGQGHHVAEYLHNFKDLNYNDIALKLIEAGQGHSVAE